MQLPAAFPSHPNHPKFQDLTGQRFGSLAVVGYASAGPGGSRWWCQCDCGQVRINTGYKLRGGKSKSCGCETAKNISVARAVHGGARTTGYAPEYDSWRSMRYRCSNPSAIGWENYGGRGISVCERWDRGAEGKSGFECFMEDMGVKPSLEHTLDRYPNNDGNYEPGNCRWATKHEQARNRRNVRVEILFFDLATRSGWACGGKSGLWEFGTFDIPRSNENIGAFLNAADRKIHDLVLRLNPKLIAFESPFMAPGRDKIEKVRKLTGLANVVEQVADRHGILCQEATISDICNHFLGSGYPRKSKRKKEATLNKCRSLGIEVYDDNAGDAIAGLSFMLAIAHPETMAGIMPLFGERLGDGGVT